MTPMEQAQLRILKILSEEPGISQRQLAVRLGISLGKINYLLKALLEKGLIKAGNFRRNDHKLGYLYLLTPEGMKAKISLTRAYLARKEAEYQALREEIETMRAYLALQEGAALRAEQAEVPDAAGSAANDYISRCHDLKYQETLFELMARQYEIARLDEAREGALVQVVDAAVPPELESRPRQALVAVVTTLATGLLLLVYVFLHRALRNTHATAEGAQKQAALRAAFGGPRGKRRISGASQSTAMPRSQPSPSSQGCRVARLVALCRAAGIKATDGIQPTCGRQFPVSRLQPSYSGHR